MSGERAETAWAPWDLMSRVVDALLSLPQAVASVAGGGAGALGRGLDDATEWLRAHLQLRQGPEPGVRHTLRIVEDESDGAAAFSSVGGATHTIRYDPSTPHAQAALAHGFAHVLLAVVRGGPAEEVGASTDAVPGLRSAETHVEECAAWALARAITRGEIWNSAALAHREQILRAHGVLPWARAPRIPHLMSPTRAVVRWLAQVES